MRFLLILLFAAAAFPDSLDKVKAESNLEKRSDLALEHGKKLLKDTRKAYDAGQLEAAKSLVEEVQAAVQLSAQSLEETNKNPRRKSKHFKRAEIRTREMLRDVDALSQHMSYADRPMLESLRKELQRTNEELLRGIMGMK